MSEAIAILLTTIFVNNIVTIQFLGLCPLFAASRKFDTAIAMAVATTFLLTLASAASYIVETYVLHPLDLQYLRIIAFVILILLLVRSLEYIIRATQPRLYAKHKVIIPLISTNCALLGVVLINIREAQSFLHSILFGFSAAIGFSLLLIILAAILEQQRETAIPTIFRGAAINMITAGLISLAFMGFVGMG